MTEQEQFEEILRELGELLLQLGDLSWNVVLIGGQVLALESLRKGGSGVIAVTTDTGAVIERGYSHEPDLLFDMDGTEFGAERLPEVLKLRGYERTRSFRWSKTLPGGVMHLDLFAPAGVDLEQLPTNMTPLPDARLALRGSQPVFLPMGETSLRIRLPDAVGFLSMKVRAKLEQRPTETKDCFDIFAYVKLVGLDDVRASLKQAGEEGQALRAKLQRLFWSTDAAGVLDIIAYAEGLEEVDRALLAQAAVDLFADL
ncbi:MULTISPECIES: hypothetical protein [Myxococcus]|nr:MULTISPECIES: hypothetical protein [Myxococcus]WAM26608.1 hypothetical protein OZ403_00390 [Myxococcus sp. NMCA1]